MKAHTDAKNMEQCIKSTLDEMREINEILGVPPVEILKKAIADPKSIRIYRDATRQMKELSK